MSEKTEIHEQPTAEHQPQDSNESIPETSEAIEQTDTLTEATVSDDDQQQNEDSNIEEKLNELNDKYVRLHAEFDNYRRRTNKEKLDLITQANEKLLLDLLPTIDDFERAIANNKNVDDIEAVKEGFVLIYNKFMATLQAKGLTQMNALGTDFDSDLHDAIANVPSPDDQKGKVIDDVEKGYLLNDKVIRFAKVVVGN